MREDENMRINFSCEECGFGIEAELHKNNPKINDLIKVHYKEFGHMHYKITYPWKSELEAGEYKPTPAGV